MKLLSFLTNIISEQSGQRTYLVGPALKDKIRIDVFATHHQQVDRNGNINPYFDEYSVEARRITSGSWKSGVPNKWILDSIRNNFDTIYDIFEDNKSNDDTTPKILFVDETEFDGDLYNIEYVLSGKKTDVGRWRANIITSALQQYGRQFLKPKPGLPYKRLSESKEFENILVVYLCK